MSILSKNPEICINFTLLLSGNWKYCEAPVQQWCRACGWSWNSSAEHADYCW